MGRALTAPATQDSCFPFSIMSTFQAGRQVDSQRAKDIAAESVPVYQEGDSFPEASPDFHYTAARTRLHDYMQ